MKKIGYQPISPERSIGGHPQGASHAPVLGAAAFIIADTPWVFPISRVSAAVVPAILYFWSIWCCLSSRRQSWTAGAAKEPPRVKVVLVKSGYMSYPFRRHLFLVWDTTSLYADAGNSHCILLSFVKKEDSLTSSPSSPLEDGSKSAFPSPLPAVIVGVVIGMMAPPGCLKVGDVILSFTKGNLMLT
jgi:TRAP-type uncharacterized transport system fused permease subunit